MESADKSNEPEPADTDEENDPDTPGPTETADDGTADDSTVDNNTVDDNTADDGTEESQEETDPPFEIDTSSFPPSQEHTLGRFTLRWRHPGDGPMKLAIYHEEAPNRAIWESVPGEPFANARFVRGGIRESRGSFEVEEKILKDCVWPEIETIDGEDLQVAISGRFADCEVAFRLEFETLSEAHLGFALRIDPEETNQKKKERWCAVLVYSSDPQEHFYGFGEQFTHFDLKGRRLPILVQEQGVGRGLEPVTSLLNAAGNSGGAWHTSYAPVPHYLTNTNRSLFLENYEYSVFDFREDDRAQVQVHATQMRGRILYGDNPLELIERFTEYSGRMPALPEWVGRGAVVALMGGSQVVRDRLDALEERGTPISALWTQDWVGQRITAIATRLWWNWQVDRTLYPDWEELIAEMEDRGIRVMSYINPYLSDASKSGIHERNLFAEAEQLGYLIVNGQGKPVSIGSGGFNFSIVDLSNEAARSWYKDLMREEFIEKGISGWMADFGEAVPYTSVLDSGESPHTFHNRFPELWAELNREVVEEWGGTDELLFFSRSGFTRSPGQVPLFWLGDQLVTWDKYDGIKTAVTGMLSSGLSGFALNHSDIGGYVEMDLEVIKYHRSKELLLRWMELAAFTAMYRNHEGNSPDSGSYQIYTDGETMDAFARFAKVYTALAEYRSALMDDVANRGIPLVRHPVLHYPEDPEVWDLEYEFMLGPDVLVAPVLDRGENQVTVYLPAGKWTHLFTGETLGNGESGTWVDVEAPLGTPAAFAKQDSAAQQQIRSKFIALQIIDDPADR